MFKSTACSSAFATTPLRPETDEEEDDDDDDVGDVGKDDDGEDSDDLNGAREKAKESADEVKGAKGEVGEEEEGAHSLSGSPLSFALVVVVDGNTTIESPPSSSRSPSQAGKASKRAASSTGVMRGGEE